MLRRWKNKHANCELTDESIEKALTPQAARHAIQYKGKWYKGPTYLYRDLGDIVEIPFARFHAKLTKWKKENPNCKPKDEDINSFFKRTRVQVDDGRFIGPLRLMWEELPEPKIQWDFVRQKVTAFRNEFGREPTKEEIKEISTPEEWMNRLDDPNLLGSNNRVLKKAPNVIKITSREITIAGETFSSLTKAAKHYDINMKTFCYRIKHGWTPEEAAELVNKKVDNRPKEISIGGKTFPSGSAAAKYYGITPSNFNTRLIRGWTPEQAAGIEPPPKKA
jgi:hypothetical protein